MAWWNHVHSSPCGPEVWDAGAETDFDAHVHASPCGPTSVASSITYSGSGMTRAHTHLTAFGPIPHTEDDIQACLLLGNSSSTHIKIEVDSTGAGVYQNLCSLVGFDWVVSASHKEDLDDPVASLTVKLRREIGAWSLVPFVENSQLNLLSGSYVPMLDAGRRIYLYTATMPPGTTPGTADWRTKFAGYIDEVDCGGDGEITLTARDLGARLQDTFIETTAIYGSDVGLSVQSQIQAILDAALGAAVVTLYTPISPGWNLHRWEQEKVPLADAVRQLASQIGWDVRYTWRPSTAQFELTLAGPYRGKTAPDRVLGAGQYMLMPQARITRGGIRNAIRVVYADATTGARTTVVVTDAVSIARYGRRFMEVAEAAASNVDALAEATTFANGMLGDLKLPALEASAKMLYSPLLNLQDLVRFSPDGVYFDMLKDLAIISIVSTFSCGEADMTLGLRGAPAGGYERWLDCEARPGVAPSTDTGGPGTPGSVAVTPSGSGFLVTYDEPTDPTWLRSECHVGDTSGFTLSEATLKGSGKTTRFVIGGLVHGQAYYVKIIAIDQQGNKSTASTQVVTAMPLIGPLHENGWVDKQNMLQNGELCIWSLPRTQALNPPDGWEAVDNATPTGTGYWPDDVLAETADTSSGNNAVRVKNRAAAYVPSVGIRSATQVPAVGSEIYRLEVLSKQVTGVGSTTTPMNIYLMEHDIDGAAFGYLTTGGDATNDWSIMKLSGRVASGTRWLTVYALKFMNGTTYKDLLIDSIKLSRVRSSFSAWNTGSVSIAAATWTKLTQAGVIVSDGPDYSHTTDKYTVHALDTGRTFSFRVTEALVSLAAGKGVMVGLYKNGALVASSPVSISIGATNTQAALSVSGLQGVTGDYFEAYIYHNDTVSRSTVAVSTTTEGFGGFRE